MLSGNPKVIGDALEIRKKYPERKVIVPELRPDALDARSLKREIDPLFKEIPPGGLTFYVANEGKMIRMTIEELG